MKMIPSSINLSVAWVVMVSGWQLVLTGIRAILFLMYHHCCFPLIRHLIFSLYDFSNLFRVFGCAAGSTEATSLEASKNPMRYLSGKMILTSTRLIRFFVIVSETCYLNGTWVALVQYGKKWFWYLHISTENRKYQKLKITKLVLVLMFQKTKYCKYG